jgi:serine protease AprX
MRKIRPFPGQLRWRIRWTVALALGTSLLLAPAATQARVQAAPLPAALSQAAAQHPRARVSVIVQFNSRVRQNRAKRIVRSAGGHNLVVLPIIHAVASVMPLRAAAHLGHHAGVHAVTLNTAVKSQSYRHRRHRGVPDHVLNLPSSLSTTFPFTVGAPSAWAYGASGAGVGVAVIDSGVDGQLPDFSTSSAYGSPASRVVETAVANPGASDASDPVGHGTMVAGIIAGNSINLPTSDSNYGKYAGVAPNANLISVKVGDDHGNSNELAVIMGIQFAVQHQADFNIRVINLSLLSSIPQSYMTDPLDAAVESAWQHGIVVVVAAGNRGKVADAANYAPANDPYAITVGALDEQGQTNLGSDTVAPYSSVGTSQDGHAKPDLYAPGSHMTSVLAPNSMFAEVCPQCVRGGRYLQATGTSFAAPVVSGAAADLLSRDPYLTPDQVKGTLLQSAQELNGDGPTVRALRLSAAVSSWQHPEANQGLTPSTLLDASNNLAGWPGTSFDRATGDLGADYARSSWSQSSWSRSSWSRSSWSQSSWSQSSWSQSSWSQSSWSVFGPN